MYSARICNVATSTSFFNDTILVVSRVETVTGAGCRFTRIIDNIHIDYCSIVKTFIFIRYKSYVVHYNVPPWAAYVLAYVRAYITNAHVIRGYVVRRAKKRRALPFFKCKDSYNRNSRTKYFLKIEDI